MSNPKEYGNTVQDMTEPRTAESVVIVDINGDPYYPHYFSTYCIHGLHERCRLTCKHCEKLCRCDCHRAAHSDGGDGA